MWPGKTLGPLKSHACLVKKQLITMHNMQVHMTVLGVRQYENRVVSTKHAWSGKTLGLSKSKYRHITSEAFLVTCQCSVNPCLQKMSPLGTRTQARADLAVSSSGARVQLEAKIVLQFLQLPKYEEMQQEPVGCEAVGFNLTEPGDLSCVPPESWHLNVNCLESTSLNVVSPGAAHHHEPFVDDSHREGVARLQHIGHLSFL